MVLKDIKKKKGPNPGGGINLFVTPIENVLSIPQIDPITKTVKGDIVLKPGTNWNKFEFSPGKLKPSNPTVGEDGSGSFESLVDVYIAGDDPENLDLFNGMINGDFILLVDMASKNVKIGGTMRAPMLLKTATWDGGSDQPDPNGTAFQFKGRDGNIMATYTGSLPVII